MLTTIKNAQAVGKTAVTFPYSKMVLNIANILKDNGYLSAVEVKTKKMKKSEQNYISASLKYGEHGGAIEGIKIVSRPSRRMYLKASEIKPVRSGHGIAVISTPSGILTSKEAKKANAGGEILFEIW